MVSCTPKIREIGLYEDVCNTFPKSERIVIWKSGGYFSIDVYLKDGYKEIKITFNSISEFLKYKNTYLKKDE